MKGYQFITSQGPWYVQESDTRLIDKMRSFSVGDRLEFMEITPEDIANYLEETRLKYNQALQRSLKRPLRDHEFGERISRDFYFTDILNYPSYSAFIRKLQRHHLSIEEVERVVKQFKDDSVCHVTDEGYTFFDEIFEAELKADPEKQRTKVITTETGCRVLANPTQRDIVCRMGGESYERFMERI